MSATTSAPVARGRPASSSTSPPAARLVGGGGVVHAVDGVSFCARAGRDARPRRRVGQRQVHGRQLHRSGSSSRPRARSGCTGRDITSPLATRAAAAAAQAAHGLPGPVLVAQPAHDDRRRSSASRCGCTGSPAAATLDARVAELFDQVGLRPELRHRYPHELSGGQRQRVGLARALAVEPQAADRRRAGVGARRLGAGVDPQPAPRPAAGHGLLVPLHHARPSTVEYLCDRVAVMYLGKIVEVAPRDQLFAAPRHPYTQALLSAAVVPDPVAQRGAAADRARGRHPEPDRPAVRLRVPHALPARGTSRRRGPSRRAAAAERRAATGRLPPRRARRRRAAR